MKTLSQGIDYLRRLVIEEGTSVSTNTWQGKESPGMFKECLGVSIKVQMEEEPDVGRQPWADEHFAERVSGQPLNPPPSHLRWSTGTTNYFEKEQKFSHSYPERMWPKTLLPHGIRYNTADLNTLVEVIKNDPQTRQAYLPIFFPEDLTAASKGDRVPCTLGWQFIVRENQLHCFYPIRSCDVARHLHNDIYFANRLALWIRSKADLHVSMGSLHFVCTSLHCFEQDIKALKIMTEQSSPKEIS